jgi:mercuric ion binding protein
MNKSLLALVFAGALFVGCKETSKAPEKNTTETTAKNETAVVGKQDSRVSEQAKQTASFNIEGMTCAMGCAKTIESKLAAMDGVTKASVDFEKKSATVEYDSAKQSPEKIAEAVEAVAGGETYKVNNMKSSQDHASLFNKEKKKKKKAKEDKKNETKKEGCATETKGGCCAGKKSASCHSM